MSSKVLLFVVAGLLQASLVLSQGMTPTQMWNPYSWIAPYYTAATDAWSGYVKNTQQAGNQLYQQWDKTGAADLFSAGLSFATQAAQIAAQQAQQAAKIAAEQAQIAAQEAAKQAQEAANQAQQEAQAGYYQAQ